jgi:hypothetical protein
MLRVTGCELKRIRAVESLLISFPVEAMFKCVIE